MELCGCWRGHIYAFVFIFTGNYCRHIGKPILLGCRILDWDNHILFFEHFQVKAVSMHTFSVFTHSRLPEPDKHKYISLIEYCLHNPEFSTVEACNATGLSNKEFSFIADAVFSLNANQSQGLYKPEQKQDWILKPEAYFSYLQYLEFRHSIEHSRRAYWLAVLAIVVSIIGVGISLK